MIRKSNPDPVVSIFVFSRLLEIVQDRIVSFEQSLFSYNLTTGNASSLPQACVVEWHWQCSQRVVLIPGGEVDCLLDFVYSLMDSCEADVSAGSG